MVWIELDSIGLDWIGFDSHSKSFFQQGIKKTDSTDHAFVPVHCQVMVAANEEPEFTRGLLQRPVLQVKVASPSA